MKTICSVCIALFLLPALAVATVYECTDREGHKVYNQTGGHNCRTENLGSLSGYTPPVAVKTKKQTKAKSVKKAKKTSQTREQKALETAEANLNKARKALETGRNERFGGERNYAKYQARIEKLENRVHEAEEKRNAAQEKANQTR